MDRLTRRQAEIVVLRCRQGMTNAQVAAALGLSPQTVKNHVTAVLRKLGAVGVDQVCYRAGYAAGLREGVPGLRPDYV